MSAGRSPYYYRNKLLLELGFKDYAEYLASDLWAKIRRRVMWKYRSKCFACGNPATQVHHKSYSKKTLLGKHISCLKAICGDCHRDIEFREGEKVGLVDANEKLKSLFVESGRIERNGRMFRRCEQCKTQPTKGNHRFCAGCNHIRRLAGMGIVYVPVFHSKVIGEESPSDPF